MGQRSQLIVKLPELFYNENNPNNKHERVRVYHNQWLYGINFIKYLARLIKACEYLDSGEGKYVPRDYENILDKAILHCNSADLDYMTNTHVYNEETKDDNLKLFESKSVLDFLNWFDNNNGYIYLSIDKKRKIKYCILNGTGDNDEIEIRTPKEYINLYYTNDKIKDEKELLEAIKFLESYPTTDIFKELNNFKKKLDIMIPKEVAKIL